MAKECSWFHDGTVGLAGFFEVRGKFYARTVNPRVAVRLPRPMLNEVSKVSPVHGRVVLFQIYATERFVAPGLCRKLRIV